MHLLAAGLLPSDSGGGVPALSAPPKPAPPALAEPDDDRVRTTSKPAADAKPDPSQKVGLACLPAWHTHYRHPAVQGLLHADLDAPISSVTQAVQCLHCTFGIAVWEVGQGMNC